MDFPSATIVSIIIPAYNAEKTLSQTVASIMEQEIAACEILVTDDGSTDRTAAILEGLAADPRVHVLRHPEGKNRGVCASRRLALTEAKGEFIAFLDADDRYLPGKLARHLQILRERPEIVLVHGAVTWIGPKPEHPGVALAFKLSDQPRTYDLHKEPYYLRSNIICNSTVVTRRSAIDLDAFPASMIYQSEDWVLWNMIAPNGLFFYDPAPLTEYLFHAESYTFQSLRRTQVEDLSFIEFYTVIISRLPRAWMQVRAAKLLLYRIVSMSKNELALSQGGKTGSAFRNFDSTMRAMLFGFLLGGIKVLLRSLSATQRVWGYFKGTDSSRNSLL